MEPFLPEREVLQGSLQVIVLQQLQIEKDYSSTLIHLEYNRKLNRIFTEF